MSKCALLLLVISSALAEAPSASDSGREWKVRRHSKAHHRGHKGAAAIQADVCVFGGTSAGVVAAAEAARLGKTVVLAEPGNHLGGMSSGGLGATDTGTIAAIGGISREFYRRIGQHYGVGERFTFEPHVAEQVFQDLIAEAGVPVYFQERLASVQKDGTRITQIAMESGDVFRASMFIDATYEGDLMARAGVSYVVGRESNATYGETLNGIRSGAAGHQFSVAVDPYLEPGNPDSGLLPFVQDDTGGAVGQGDARIQAYNFRLCLTQNSAIRVPVDPPADYNPDRYELLARYLEARVAAGQSTALSNFMNISAMPNGKTDVNNNGGFSTDFIGGNWDYPDADYQTRAGIRDAHESYTRGLLTFLATSPRVPDGLRSQMQSWGLCGDEFPDTGGWPHQLYVREARRMVSDYVMTERNCRSQLTATDSVGLASYTMDTHNAQRIARSGRAFNEGDVQTGVPQPYPISYRSIIPTASECENLLLPVTLSASHVAHGSIRMEPVFMILGHSAAAAASLAIDGGTSVQSVDIDALQAQLLAENQILTWN